MKEIMEIKLYEWQGVTKPLIYLNSAQKSDQNDI